jgi:hypothetical protein
LPIIETIEGLVFLWFEALAAEGRSVIIAV